MKLVFLGPPGAGKGTNAKRVSSNFNIPHISTGDILREAVKNQTDLGKKAKSIIDKGDLVPDDIMNELVKEKLSKMNNFILDGYPRTQTQAKYLNEILDQLDKKLDAVVLIDVDEEEVVKRISSRRVCSECGEVYNIYTLKPKIEGLCDKCGSKLIHRDDDKENTVRDRYQIYMKNTAPLIEYYKKNNQLLTIDGAKSVAEVTKNMFNILQGVSSNDNNQD